MNNIKKENIIKKIIIIVIGILLMCEIGKIVQATNEDVKRNDYYVEIFKDGESIYNNTNENSIIQLYNSLMIPMDEVFNSVFGQDYISDEELTLICGETELKINTINNEIELPKIKTYGTEVIDDTIYVEIEEVNKIKYIPLYLVANIDGIQVKVNDELLETELWKEEANKRIEKYRKNDINIVVKNQNGIILNNASVDIQMLNNEFNFGTAIRYWVSGNKNLYRNITKDRFNTIVSENEFKWYFLQRDGIEPAKDIVKYATENDLYLRGHCLWWDYICSDSLTNLVGNNENPEEQTMAYIYNQYKNENITYEQASNMIKEVKEKFENIVLNHIDTEMSDFSEAKEWDVVNEPITKQFFKYYLYDEKFLEDETFLSINNKSTTDYEENEEYYQFLAKCFNKAREKNPNAQLVLNDDKIKGNSKSTYIEDLIKIINNISKYTSNIDKIGIQYHVDNKYQHTAQSYYNQINHILNRTNIKKAVITEYDNYESSKLNNYTSEEKKNKAEYLRDTLISAYSNKNIDGFIFWVYNSQDGKFVDEEYEEYNKLMEEWLNYKNTILFNGETETYKTRLYNGEYLANINLNGKSKQVRFNVSSEQGWDNTINIEMESDLKQISIKNKPFQQKYIQNYQELNLSGGVIEVEYDDETTLEVPMDSKDVVVSQLDNSKLGYQTIEVTYKDKKVTFTVEVIKKEIEYVEIGCMPEKTIYNVGEDIDLTGGTIIVYYNDKTQDIIEMTRTNEVSIINIEDINQEEKVITLKYKEYNVEFKVIVDKKIENENSDEITKIEIIKYPRKLLYIQNYENLDLTGGVIKVIYANGEKKEIAMTSPQIKTTGFDNSNLGKKIINISYKGKSTFFEVEIIKKSIEEIKIEEDINNSEYNQGEDKLNTDEINISIEYNDKTTSTIPISSEDVRIEGFETDNLGEKAIRVVYGEKSTTFVIKVNESNMKTGNVANKNLPNTGFSKIIIIFLFGILGFGLYHGRKYSKYKKDTYKQL